MPTDPLVSDIDLLRQMFIDNLGETTATVLMKWADEIRTQEVEKMRGILNMQQSTKAENEAQYRFTIAKFKEETRYGNKYGIITEEPLYLTDWELKQFAAQNDLEYGKLLAVALGDKERYKGWVQGPLIKFTYGKKFTRPDTDKHPSDDTPIPEKQGARGLFRVGMRRDRNFDND